MRLTKIEKGKATSEIGCDKDVPEKFMLFQGTDTSLHGWSIRRRS